MKFTALTSVLIASAGIVSAFPWGPKGGYPGAGGGFCLTDAQAQSIVSDLIVFLEHTDLAAANATAYALLSDTFLELGDSINSVAFTPLGSTVFNSKPAYIAGTLGTPANPGINTVELIHTCDRITWYWEFTSVGGPGKDRVRGFDLMTITPQLQISKEYVEFNSLVWANNTGWTLVPPPRGNAKRSIDFDA